MKETVFYSEYFYERGSKDTGILEKTANEYPTSSLATFLLLYHYKKINHPGFEKLAKKTALLFNNPRWLQFQLNHESGNHPELELSDSIAIEEMPEVHNNNLPAEIPDEKNFITESVDNSMEENENHEIINAVSEDISEPAGIESSRAEMEENVTTAETAQEIYVPALEIGEDQPTVSSGKEEEVIAFEPLHTVDYFASQGIKITDELISNDKLGSQMKSFTEWLKSMKKLHPSKLAEQSLASERFIQTAADESNINAEVLTEAMAEVLIKQDKKEKAIEMFSKLSLINPAKSAYFAAKIESIKSS